MRARLQTRLAMTDGPMDPPHAACVGCQSLDHAHAGRAIHPCTFGVLRTTFKLEMQMEDSDICDAATCTMSHSTLDFAVHREAIRARLVWVATAACMDIAPGWAKRVIDVVLPILGYRCQRSLIGLRLGPPPFCHPLCLYMSRTSAQASPIFLTVQVGLVSLMAAPMSWGKVQYLLFQQRLSTCLIRLPLELPTCHQRLRISFRET